MKLLLVFAIASVSWAQAAITITRTCLPSVVKPGATLTCTDTMSGGNTSTTGPAGVQWQFTPSQAMGTPAATAGAAAIAAGKSVSSNSSGLILVSGINQTLIADGVLAVVTYQVPLSASCPGNSPCLVFNPSNAVGSTIGGGAIAVTINPTLAVSVSNFCDLNADGAVNSADVAIEVTAVLNGTAADRNGDTKTNVQDVVLIDVAAAGGACLATK